MTKSALNECREKYYAYWGKARPNADQVPYHLLVYHCLDVAAVATEYLRRAPALCERISKSLGITDSALTLQWCGFWVALHDLGKFSEAFQAQCPDVFEALRERSPRTDRLGTLRHDGIGMLLWRECVEQHAIDSGWFGDIDADHLEFLLNGMHYWISAVTGHHGKPAGPSGGQSLHQFCVMREDSVAARQFSLRCAKLFQIDRCAEWLAQCDPTQFEGVSKTLSWWIAGLTVLADWIGSNQRYFPYRSQCEDDAALEVYWQYAQESAIHALNDAEVLAHPARRGLDFSDLFPAIEQPSPLQQWALNSELAAGPQIYCLEDVTGAGKTEAAIALAYRIMEMGEADGIFIGLPTMATANAMYGRVARMYRRLFDDKTSLTLAHGQRDLVESFAKSVLPDDVDEGDPQQQDQSASARCAAWLADHNKRSLLAPVGVGTVDQALMAALHCKHQSLRLLGLYRKVLVIDEVHACDSYMTTVLSALLEFHACAGGSAVLLSATLPAQQKHSLFRSFATGAQRFAAANGGDSGISKLEKSASSDYPLVSAWRAQSPQTIHETKIATRSAVRRTLQVRMFSDEGELITAILHALNAGQCVCWMRNTVADVLDAYEKLVQLWLSEKITVFHARFALRDRLKIEEQVLDQFGPGSHSDVRRGRLVIASQVAEQSLDADWDWLVTDLAPIDRVLQRAGRLRRHIRDAQGNRISGNQQPCNQKAGNQIAGGEIEDLKDGRGLPCLWVFAPVWSETPTANWFSAKFPRSAKVYPQHHQLWLTAKRLREGELKIPEQSRDLIESVFGDAEVPEGLERAADAAFAKENSERSIGKSQALAIGEGYSGNANALWWDEANSPSRLGDATSNVLLARWVGDQLLPWDDRALPARHAWAYSAVRVAERLISKAAEPTTTTRKAALEAVIESLPGKGRWSVVLPLELTEDGWVGEAVGKGQRNQEQTALWRYDARMGLTSGKAPGERSPGTSPAEAGNGTDLYPNIGSSH